MRYSALIGCIWAAAQNLFWVEKTAEYTHRIRENLLEEVKRQSLDCEEIPSPNIIPPISSGKSEPLGLVELVANQD